MVPFLDIRAQNAPLDDDYRAAFDRVLQSGQWILGPEVGAFEAALAELTGSRHAIGVSSGTDAILLALMALGVGPGDEVIVPAFTFFATGGCVHRAGATPVFADIGEDDFNLTAEEVERRVTPRTKAVIPVDLYGQAADMDAVVAVARAHGLAVVEDAAQALGAAYHGRAAGALGDVGTYSFYPTKNLGGFGDGGMVVTDDDDLAARARLLRVHGMERAYFHDCVGGNFRMDGIQGALLNLKLPRLAGFNRRRREIAAAYEERLGGHPAVTGGRLVLPRALPGREHIYHQYTVLLPGEGESRREALCNFLAAREVASGVYYPLTLDRQACFAHLPPPEGGLPLAHRAAATCLSLPVFPEITEAQIDEVADGVAAFMDAE